MVPLRIPNLVSMGSRNNEVSLPVILLRVSQLLYKRNPRTLAMFPIMLLFISCRISRSVRFDMALTVLGRSGQNLRRQTFYDVLVSVAPPVTLKNPVDECNCDVQQLRRNNPIETERYAFLRVLQGLPRATMNATNMLAALTY
jgi:hypothetical protein